MNPLRRQREQGLLIRELGAKNAQLVAVAQEAIEVGEDQSRTAKRLGEINDELQAMVADKGRQVIIREDRIRELEALLRRIETHPALDRYVELQKDIMSVLNDD